MSVRETEVKVVGTDLDCVWLKQGCVGFTANDT